MRKLSVLMALFLVLVTATSALAVDIEMEEQNNSGQTGTVTLEAVGDNQTRVTIDIEAGAAGVQQPAHIHEGTCENLNPQPLFPLNPVVDGMSETVVNASLATIQSAQHSVNVHLSPQEASTYVSCGTIPLVAMAAGTPANGTPAAMQPAGGTPQPAVGTPVATPMVQATPTTAVMAPATATPSAMQPAGTPAAGVSPTPSGLPSAGGIPIELIAFSGSALLALGAAAAYANRRR